MSDKPRLERAIPTLPVNDITKSMAFYSDLGFEQVYQEEGFGILRRDEIVLYLSNWPEHPVDPLVNAWICRFVVTNIEALYAQYRPKDIIHPNAPLTTMSYGFREFAITDLDNNLITFAEPVAEETKE